MPIITENELKADIKNKSFANIYFLYGKETMLCLHYADKISATAVDAQTADFNLHKFNGFDHTVDEAIMGLSQIPIFTDKKFVVLCDYDIPSLDSADKDKLIDVLENPYEDTILVLCFSSVVLYQKNPDGSLKKYIEPKWDKIIKLCSQKGKVVEFNKLTENNLEKQIESAAIKRDKRIDRNAIPLLIARTDGSMLNIKNELDKLSAYCDADTITKADVEALTCETTDNNIYRIVTAINSFDGDTAYKEINNLLIQKVRPELILGTMAAEYTTALYWSELKKAGMSRADAAKILKLPQNQLFKLDVADRLIYKIGDQCLKKIIKIFSKADERLKAYNLDDKIILEKLVSELLLTISEG